MVVRSISQSYEDSKILVVRTLKTPESIDKKFSMCDYIGDDSPHAKTQNECPIEDMAAYAQNITLARFLVFLSCPILSFFCDTKFCSCPETKP